MEVLSRNAEIQMENMDLQNQVAAMKKEILAYKSNVDELNEKLINLQMSML
jgi:hypothetical protein